jgi:hypothetical protein
VLGHYAVIENTLRGGKAPRVVNFNTKWTSFSRVVSNPRPLDCHAHNPDTQWRDEGSATVGPDTVFVRVNMASLQIIETLLFVP